MISDAAPFSGTLRYLRLDSDSGSDHATVQRNNLVADLFEAQLQEAATLLAF